MSDLMERNIIGHLNDLRSRVSSLESQGSIKRGSNGLPVFPILDEGAIPFAGAGGALTQNTNLTWLDANDVLMLGAFSDTYTGAMRLRLGGPSGSTNGPHWQAFTNDDGYPIFQFLGWSHDNISLNFDAYFDGTSWKSGDAGSNFQIYKLGDQLQFNYKSGVALGGSITWATGMVMDATGRVGIGAVSAGAKLDVFGSIYSESNGITTTGSGAGFAFVDRTTSRGWVWYGSGDLARLYNGSGDIWQIADSGAVNMYVADAVTTSQTAALTIWHRTSGTAGAGFGTDIYLNLETSTGADRNAMLSRTTWTNATDASRTSRTQMFMFDTTSREVIRMEATGSAAAIGFLGAGAVTRQSVTGSRGGNAALASLLTALANLGLITNSTTA